MRDESEDDLMNLFPLLPISLFQQSGLTDIIDSHAGDSGRPLTYGNLVKAMAGTFYRWEDPCPNRMNAFYRGDMPGHLFGRVTAADLSAANCGDMLGKLAGNDLHGMFLDCYRRLRRGFGFTSDSYRLGLDMIRIDNGFQHREVCVPVAQLTDSCNILCDCRIYRDPDTFADILEDLSGYEDPEDTKVYCDGSVLSEDMLRAVDASGFSFVARCPEERIDAELGIAEAARGPSEPTSGTKSWNFHERFDSGLRKRIVACSPASDEVGERFVNTTMRTEMELLMRMDEGKAHGSGSRTDYLGRVHPALRNGDTDASLLREPLVLVSNVRPYGYDRGMTPLTILTRYCEHCSRRRALNRVGHEAIHTEGLPDTSAGTEGMVFVRSVAVMLADVIENRVRSLGADERIDGIIDKFRDATAKYDARTNSAIVYSDPLLCDSFFSYCRAMGIETGMMFL